MTGAALWYFSRATGVVSIGLFTAVVVLGTITAGRRRPHGESATIVMALHRWLSLGSLVFLGVHVFTAIIDGYVPIPWLAVLVPFTSGYEPLLVGLGTLAVDVLVVLMVTSYLRHHIPERRWRQLHWLSYAMWGVALVHGFFLGTADQPLLRFTSITGATVAGLFAAWRAAHSHADGERRRAIRTQEWS